MFRSYHNINIQNTMAGEFKYINSMITSWEQDVTIKIDSDPNNTFTILDSPDETVTLDSGNV